MKTRKNAHVLCETLDLTDKKILDIGCGSGQLSRFMARNGAQVIGLETSAKQLSHAAKNAHDSPSVAFIQAKGQSLPFKEGCFDLLVFFNSLHHIPKALHGACFQECFRVLAPQGHIYISEPVAQGPHFELLRPIDDETEVRALAYETLQQTELWGFRMICEETFNHPVKRKNYEALRAALIGADDRRAPLFDQKDPMIRANFDRLGRLQSDGSRLFDQPTRMNLLQKTEERP